MKLIHAADLHLDSPFTGLEPEKSARRRAELRCIPERIAALVRAEGAQLVLLPGDIFDGARVTPETVEQLKGALEDMAVPVFIAPGNHDFYHPHSPYARGKWPENVHIFRTAEMEGVPLPDLGCTVHGCAFLASRRESDPLAGYTVPRDGGVHLLCLHGEIAQAGVYAPIAPLSLSGSGAVYAALGHIHACSGLQAEGGTFWAYPGCPEGRGFDECGAKGVLAVELGEGSASARFVPLAQRCYRIETAQLVDGELPEAALPPACGDLVRLILRGDRLRPLDLAALARRYEGRFFHLELRDETVLPRDVWDRCTEDSLTGLFLREIKNRLDRAEEGERAGLLLAARFGLAALERGEDIWP